MRRLSVLIVLALALLLSAAAAAFALPPDVTSFMVNSGNTATNDRSVSVQITSPDASEMRFSVDTGGWSEWGPYADTTTVVLPDVEGEHTVYGEFRNAGLEVTPRNDSIVLDRIVPHAQIHTIPAMGTAKDWYKSTPVFWFTAEEPVGVFYYWDAPPWTAFYPGTETTSPTALPAPAVLSYYAMDNAANTESIISTTFNVDETTPTVEAMGLPTGEWSKSDVTVNLNAKDEGGSLPAGVSSTLDGVTSSDNSRALATEGIHQFEYWSLDGAGNESDHKSTEIRIDKTPPATASGGAASYERAASFNLAPADSLSGVASTQWRVDGGAWQSGTQVTINTLGKHTVEYRSIDNAGNEETPKSTSVRVFSRTTVTPIPLTTAPAYGAKSTVYFRVLDSAGNPIEAGETLTYTGGSWTATVQTLGGELAELNSRALTSAATYTVTLNASDKYEASSGTYTFLPKLRFSAGSSFKTLYRNRTYTAYGYLTPKHAKTDANKVKIRIYKRGANKKYKLYKTYKTSYSSVKGFSTWSRYSAKIVIKSKGTYKLIAQHPADSKHAETWSSWDKFTVR